MTPEQRAARRVVDAKEELYRAAAAAGLSVDQARELHAPWRLRADAWLERSHRLLERRL